jgi:hypothetical protein
MVTRCYIEHGGRSLVVLHVVLEGTRTTFGFAHRAGEATAWVSIVGGEVWSEPFMMPANRTGSPRHRLWRLPQDPNRLTALLLRLHPTCARMLRRLRP